MEDVPVPACGTQKVRKDYVRTVLKCKKIHFSEFLEETQTNNRTQVGGIKSAQSEFFFIYFDNIESPTLIVLSAMVGVFLFIAANRKKEAVFA